MMVNPAFAITAQEGHQMRMVDLLQTLSVVDNSDALPIA